MTEQEYDKAATEESITALCAQLPYMESDDKRRALRTLRYLKRKQKGVVTAW